MLSMLAFCSLRLGRDQACEQASVEVIAPVGTAEGTL